MSENVKKYYFAVVKLFCIILLIIYFVYNSGKSLWEVSLEWFLLAIFLLAALCFELTGEDVFLRMNEVGKERSGIKRMGNRQAKVNLISLIAEILITLLLLLFDREINMGIYLYPIVLLDLILFFRLSFWLTLCAVMGVFINQENRLVYIAYCSFLVIVYFQNYIVIRSYQKYIDDYEREEYQLKDTLNNKDSLYREQLEKSSLAFENRMLEEKTRLSQALHDKLGHSINGTIYQLEACKLLMKKDTEQSNQIIQGVIDSLRISMDEIRSILRREKPDKKKMAYLQLIQLCEECKEKYKINAKVSFVGEDKEIAEHLWDIILDNTIEAVTNALKYAKCTELSIEIMILHKVIRCTIRDNGIGCTQMKEGMGIQGMKNRTRKVNGVLDINCEQGFHINMIIPL